MPCFEEIPFELLTSIAESIGRRGTRDCSHGCMAVRPRWGHGHECLLSTGPNAASVGECKSRSQTLAALSLTSRRLHAAATRELYRRPATHKWWLLARTLLARPELARLVDELCFPGGFQSWADVVEADVSAEVLAYYRAKREAHIATLSDHARQFYNCDLSSGVLNDDNEFEQAISVVVSLCPALKILEAEIGYFDMFHFCTPLSMLALHTVEVVHYDDRYGMNMEQMVPLFKAAPNLKVVRCRTISDEKYNDLGLTLPKVTKLDLQNAALHADALRAWLVVCPNLETFTYEGGPPAVGLEQFSPSEALQLMMEHGRKLQKVVLDETEAFVDVWTGWDERERQRVIDGFAAWGVKFELLEAR